MIRCVCSRTVTAVIISFLVARIVAILLLLLLLLTFSLLLGTTRGLLHVIGVLVKHLHIGAALDDEVLHGEHKTGAAEVVLDALNRRLLVGLVRLQLLQLQLHLLQLLLVVAELIRLIITSFTVLDFSNIKVIEIVVLGSDFCCLP